MKLKNSKSRTKFNTIEKILLLCTIITLFLNAFIKKNAGIVSYGIYISIILIVTIIFLRGHVAIRKKWLSLATILFFSGIISSLRGNEILGNVFVEFHRHIFFTAMLILSLGIKWEKYLTIQFTISFLKTIYMIGVIAALYALIFQGQHIMPVILKNSYSDYEAFTSFFSQRNVFACCLFFSSCAGVFLWEIYKKKFFLFFQLLFVLEIYCASSRASLLAVGIMICIYFYIKTRKNILIFLIVAIMMIPLLYYYIIPAFTGIQHVEAYTGITSSEIRFINWTRGIEMLKSSKAFVTGLGMGSEDVFLKRYVLYGSFHNVYIDLLFQGGLIKLSIYIIALIFTFLLILKIKSKELRSCFLAGFSSYIVYSFVESGAMLFSISYFSFLATCLFCVLPQACLRENMCTVKEIGSKR